MWKHSEEKYGILVWRTEFWTRAITHEKVGQPWRKSNLICNSWYKSLLPTFIQIWESMAKKYAENWCDGQKQNRSTEGCSKLKRSVDMTSSGKNGLNIRTNTSPKMGQDQASGGVSVLCWLAAPVAMFYGNLQNLVIRSKSVTKSSSVISSQIGAMSDQPRVSLYTVISQNVM